MGFFDTFGKSEIPDWKKHDYEICGRCGHTRTYHNLVCSKCDDCKSFLSSGEISMNP